MRARKICASRRQSCALAFAVWRHARLQQRSQSCFRLHRSPAAIATLADPNDARFQRYGDYRYFGGTSLRHAVANTIFAHGGVFAGQGARASTFSQACAPTELIWTTSGQQLSQMAAGAPNCIRLAPRNTWNTTAPNFRARCTFFYLRAHNMYREKHLAVPGPPCHLRPGGPFDLFEPQVQTAGYILPSRPRTIQCSLETA